MGKVRSYQFDAAIGVGGIGRMAKAEGISGKVNWIGIGSRKGPTEGRGPLVTFEHFVLYEEKGRDLRTIAPILARRMFSKNARVLFNFNAAEQAEIVRLLGLAKTAPPSARMPRIKNSQCPPKIRCGS
jgi:hypothetical protein